MSVQLKFGTRCCFMKRLKTRTLKDLQPLIKEGNYRIGPHAVKHAHCEGFTERDIYAALLYGKELVRYKEDQRLLVLGYIHVSPQVKIPLHVVAEYKQFRQVDVVTAFIPKEAHRVVSRERLAEILRYDRHKVKARVVGLNS